MLHYGGTLRGRFTSQAVLHDIRFGMETEHDVHTKYLPEMVKNAVKEKAAEDEETLQTGLKLVSQVFSSDKENKKKKDVDVEVANDAKVLKTEQIIDVDRFTVDAYAETIIAMAKEVNAGAEKLQDAAKGVVKAMTTSSKDRPLSDVTALFARMSSDQTYSTVISPLMVSHAFTIDPYANDYDDYTAVDDYLLKSGIIVTDDDGCEINSGAAHMGSVDISANTYYRYCSICQTILFENLCVGKPFDAVDELIEKTYKLTAYFAKQFISSLPSAKQTRNFAKTMPDAVYIDKGISTGADLPMALDALLPQVDCTTNLTDNTVVSYLAVVLEKSEEYGKPVFGSEIEQVINGCVASEGIEYTELGRQTGRMAARVLRGESAEDIPYETISNSYLYVNPDALAAYGLTVPAELSERAIDVTAE